MYSNVYCVLTECVSSWYNRTGWLGVKHQVTYHLHIIPDLSVFHNQSALNYNLFGVTETRVNIKISDRDINIPVYRIQRKDSTAIGQTGIAVYIHDFIADITRRRHDLESDSVECIWLELKPNTKRPISFVCFLYENSSVCYEWFSDFVQMIDNVRAVKPHADILLLRYCNIDLLKPHSFWDSTITLLCLTYLQNHRQELHRHLPHWLTILYKQPRCTHRGHCIWHEHQWPLPHLLYKISSTSKM